VGHQCYTHKIITERKDKFSTLRQYKGLCGFPSREESEYDILNTGHASTALSAALGMAVARHKKKENYHVVAVIGDGSLTGGMAWEALNQIGHLREELIIVLNYNEMLFLIIMRCPSLTMWELYLNTFPTLFQASII